MSQDPSGVVPILPTPFAVDGSIDEEGFASTIEAAIASGVDGVALFGLAGEFYKLTDAERFDLMMLLIGRVAKRCPVVISITPHATGLAVAEALRASEAGADALMVLPPFFAGTQTDAALRHIEAVASAVQLPVIVQYAPLQTGKTIDASLFAKVAGSLPNLGCVKVDLVPSGPMISALRSHGLRSMVGYMGLHLPEDFSRGAIGVMPTVSLSAAFVKLWKLLAADDPRARALHGHMLPLLQFMMQSIEFLLACEKEILAQRGVIRSACRREPAVNLDAIQRVELARNLEHLTTQLECY
ncbi:MAG TPA: dihydrodipicolinate synthase family protein [Acidobacteriaceae bacterium]|jgi:4-hydroxy-tetrahydrodipicolinate synthase